MDTNRENNSVRRNPPNCCFNLALAEHPFWWKLASSLLEFIRVYSRSFAVEIGSRESVAVIKLFSAVIRKNSMFPQ
jgi:hypothetical protein